MNLFTENFQMYKLDLEKAEEPEDTLLTPTGSQKKHGHSSKTSASSTALKSLTMWVTENYGKFLNT